MSFFRSAALAAVAISGALTRKELSLFELDPFPGRVADDAIETGLRPGENGGKHGLPAHRLRALLRVGMAEANDLLVAHQAVAPDDVPRQIGQRVALAGGTDPEGELRDFDRLLGKVDAVEVAG